MKFIDWFAGIGGFRKGMEDAGHECVGFCEFDKFAVASYTSMHLITDKQREYLSTLPLNKRQKEILKEEYRNGEWYANDVRRVYPGDIPDADCWCFGFPCQDISVAGKQVGFYGNRSSLFFRVMYMVGQLPEERKPTYLFIENVKNLLSVNGGWDFARLLVEMDRVGYDAEWQVINSSDYVPQNRERCFIIGHLRGRSSSKVFPVERTGGKNSIQIIGHRDAYRRNLQTYDPSGIIETLDTCAGGGREPHTIVNVSSNSGIVVVGNIDGNDTYMKDRGRILDIYGISQAQRATDYKDPIKVFVPVLTPDRAKKRQNGRRFKEDGDDSFTLTSQDRHGVCVSIEPGGGSDTHEGIYVKISDELTVYAIWYEKYQCYIAIRKLTPKECFRLQGWTDDYFEKAQFVNSDSQLYKQAGNGVTVDVIREIAKRFSEPKEEDE